MAESENQQKMLLFVGTYDEKSKADEDYRALLDLHKAGWVGTYDVGVVAKSADGKLDIVRHTDSTGKGARRGLVIGAVLGLIFPPSILAGGLVGAGVGSVVGHSMNDISREDLKEIGDLIQNNQIAMVILGEPQLEEGLRRATKQAAKQYKKEFNADVKDYNKQLDEAIKEA